MRTHTSFTLFALLILIAWLVATVVSAPFKTHSAHALPALTQDGQDPASDKAPGQDPALTGTTNAGDELQDNDQGDEDQANDQESLGFIDFAIIVRSLFLVGIPGILGGFVAGRFRPTENVGDITNAVTGLLGAYAIFLIIPGEFNVTSSQSIEFKHLVEIIGLAAVGGFGGQAILTFVLDKALGAKVEKLGEQQEQQRAGIESAIAAEKAAQKVLQDDETALKDVAALAKIFKKAAADVLAKIFYSAREQRKDNEAPLIHEDGVGLSPAVTTNRAALKRHRKKIENTELVFLALIACDTEQVYKRTHAQLSYVLTGRRNPDWKKAETEISSAIAMRDKQADMVGRNRIYEFRLACILIEIAKEADALPTLDTSRISDLLLTAAGDRTHADKIKAAFNQVSELPGGELPKEGDKDYGRYERYASLVHFALAHPKAAKELLGKLEARGA